MSAQYYERYLQAQVNEDLQRKMVFIGGPRQVGKTTFATQLREKGQFTYLNWDIDANRALILAKELGNTPLLVLDEIHKNRSWRGYVKGLHLLKHVYWLEDSQGKNIELRYFRDHDAREVDFVVLEDNKPILFVECKLSDQEVSPQLKYLCGKYKNVSAYQVHLKGRKDYQTPEGIQVCPASRLLKQLT
jgi:predicted AAA+ superfamily ATPase